MVERYTLMMRNGAKFPPIVVATNDKSVIDGNTRIAAARRLGYETIAAYVVKPAYASTARRIGAALNQLSGATLTDEELQAVARDFLEDQVPDGEIARRLGRTPEWARKFRRREEFTARAGRASQLQVDPQGGRRETRRHPPRRPPGPRARPGRQDQDRSWLGNQAG